LEAALDRMRAHERALAARLIDGLQQISGIQLYGITAAAKLEHRAPTVSLIWPPHRPETLARWLADHQVFATHGDHYATALMSRLGLAEQGGTLRIGMAHYNTASEVDLVLELLAGYRP
jgi:selenocysteine lyase/cysteine desulfurase